jgi:hypothetical protein
MKQGRKGNRDVEKCSVERKRQRGLLSTVNGTWREKQLETIQELFFIFISVFLSLHRAFLNIHLLSHTNKCTNYIIY